MEHFSYSLSLTLVHSLWQSVLLLGLYLGFTAIAHNIHPVAKRNMLFSLLIAQLFLSVSTFFIYYSNSFAFSSAFIAAEIKSLFYSEPFFVTMVPWIITTYIIVLLYKFTALLAKWMLFKSNGIEGRIKPPTDIKLFTKIKAYQYGIKRKVSIWYSSKITSPMTFGFFKPVILLPLALVSNLSLQDTESLIIHELTHIKNNDYFLNWILVITETIFFFNPFITAMGNRIRLEREKNCDTHVLQFNYHAIGYAETLLKAATIKKAPSPFFLGAAFGNAQLLSRIRFFTTEKNLVYNKRNHAGIAISFAVILIFINLFFLNSVIKKNNGDIVNLTSAVASYPVKRISEIQADLFTAKAVLPVKNHSTKKLPLPVNIPAEKQGLNDDALPVAKNNNESFVQEYEQETQQYAFPAAINDAEIVKEITVKDENSVTGEIVTRLFQLKFINGQWETRLLLTVTESRPIYDSSKAKKDSIILINPVQ